MIPEDISRSAERLLEACRQNGLKIATVESCTGGLVAAALTAIAGSSDVVDRGFVTYTNEAKTELAGVPWDLFERVGAVSEDVARAMAKGGVEHSNADIAVGITGVAGPGGGSVEKPVGLVHISAYREGGAALHERNVFPGDRDAVRLASVRKALAMMQSLAEK
jgi:nicotinamide-nucleotide amidase